MSSSLYEEMFGKEAVGRPQSGSLGVESGDPKITERARRRAARVLRSLHAEEFEHLMRGEIDYLSKESADVH